MSQPGNTGAQLVLIRHAPVAQAGRLVGRTDADARIDAKAVAALAEGLGRVAGVVTSPARRCRQTAAALWPKVDAPTDARLWEQDFGAHDGLALADLPDLGPMSSAEIAAYRPPGGESFDDLCTRAFPALSDCAARAHALSAPLALVVHAGIVRAALAQVLAHRPAAMAFEVSNLSVTRLRVGAKGAFSVIEANRTWP
ncbi:histidine phosphatase family protein [Thalassococcus sp. BH17M4-6]|uniref:histidine phosphatase family protein n=1 Tax=Thalassococcus sp. BH17M4-6 TaxID=3413148 RepID=UPI003BCB2ADE